MARPNAPMKNKKAVEVRTEKLTTQLNNKEKRKAAKLAKKARIAAKQHKLEDSQI